MNLDEIFHEFCVRRLQRSMVLRWQSLCQAIDCAKTFHFFDAGIGLRFSFFIYVFAGVLPITGEIRPFRVLATGNVGRRVRIETSVLHEEIYLDKRINGWRRLQELTIRAERSFRDLSGAEIVEFVRLYRQASGDLAFLITHSSNQDVVDFLNTVVSRAYACLYKSRPKKFGAWVNEGLTAWAQTVRRQAWSVLVATLLFFGAGFWAAGMMTFDPPSRAYFIQPGMEELFDHWKKGEFERRSADENLAMAGFYAANNPSVALRTVGLAAATGGIGSVYILWSNGLLIGALSHEMASVGKLGFLYASIAPHGISEIGGILIAGAAGLVIGMAFIRPGRRTLLDSLKHAGKDAFQMSVVAIIMIFLAAPIEGFFSFNPAVPQAAKVAFALVAFVGWMAFFIGYGRDKPEIRD